MILRTRICEGCGKEFAPNGTAQKFCTKECWQKYGAVYIPKRMRRKKSHSILAELNQQARDAGLTYGKYIALVEKVK